MTIPQILLIWQTKTAAGVSLFAWLGFIAYNTIWLMYGIVRKDPPIIISNSLWVSLQIVVVISVLLYR
jgi:MtN3 and saliva related transmembrane protein